LIVELGSVPLSGCRIHFDGVRETPPSPKAHPGIRVSGLSELAERCAGAGYPPEFDTRFPGRRRFYVHDPDGNRLEFFELD
jgi:catechol 2,3-dioxygenase-like lactoylglutathione lyase family enzyme